MVGRKDGALFRMDRLRFSSFFIEVLDRTTLGGVCKLFRQASYTITTLKLSISFKFKRSRFFEAINQLSDSIKTNEAREKKLLSTLVENKKIEMRFAQARK